MESSPESVHPAGEAVFEFPTYGGMVVLSTTEDALTPFGGLVPWAAFQKRSEILERLVQSCPVARSSPNATPVFDLLCGFFLNVLCEGSRFSHGERLREDPTIQKLFGLKRGVPGTDAILRFFKTISEEQGRAWVAEAARHLWSALPGKFILDWDSTVLTRYGHQEDAEVGYNPEKRGRPSHHPLLAVVSGTRLCPYYRWRPGTSSSAGEWREAMAESLIWLGKTPWLNRGDIGFCQEKILNWHEEESGRPHYLFKLKLTRNVQRAFAKIDESEWQGAPTLLALQVAETTLQLHGWSRPRRVVLGRRLMGTISAERGGTFWETCRHEYEAYVTDLSTDEANGWQIVDLYRQRADCENVFDELKNHWGFSGFCSKKKEATALAARLVLLAYNLWIFFLRLMQPERHVEAFQGRRWFLLIAARIVKSGRQTYLKIAATGDWWRDLKSGYERICVWLKTTATQLRSPPDFSIQNLCAPFDPLKITPATL